MLLFIRKLPSIFTASKVSKSPKFIAFTGAYPKTQKAVFVALVF
jgi:hypothetical protein